MKSLHDVSALGAAIRAERTRLRVSQEQLAAAAGVGPRLIGEIERGKPTAEIGKVFDVLNALGLRIGIEPS
jgi:y4mF family transcriptional regulator